MQRATQEEIERALQLVSLLESACDYRNFESPRFPDTDEKAGDPLDTESLEDLQRFYTEIRKLCPGLMRVVYGFQVLVDNCCDPDKESLEWMPGTGPDITHAENIEVAAAAIANARGGRRGAPVVDNVLDMLPATLVREVNEDAKAALEAVKKLRHD